MTDPSGSRVLFCAFAEVPGTTAAGTRMAQWLSVFGTKEMDALSLKGREAAHIQRLGGARMMRVPNTVGKPFLEKLSTYQRALQRQLSGEAYDLVWCADLFSAAAVAPILKGTSPLIVEVPEVPSSSKVLVHAKASEDAELKKSWRDGERLALRTASKVFLPSRHAAKLLSERIDPRLVQVIPRCIDRSIFNLPSVEIALDDERLVVIFGGREGGAATKSAVALAQALAITLAVNVRIGILGMPTPLDSEVRAALGKVGLQARVELIDADSSLAVSAALSLAHVVLVPSSAEDELEPLALPNRALEAMACGRAVVVTGPDAAFKDAAVPGEHFVAAPAREPRRAADAVEALLDDPLTRASLGRAAARHVERTADLMSRAQEVQAIVAEATDVNLRLHPPRGDDPDTSSKSAPVRGASPGDVDSGPSPTAVAAPVPALSTRPPMPSRRPALDAKARGATAATAAHKEPPSSSGDGVFAAIVQPMATVRMEVPNLGSSSLDNGAGGGMWDGDTFLDGGLEHVPLAIETSPDAARVREAMLVSSDAQSKADASVPTSPPLAGSAERSAGFADPPEPSAEGFAADAARSAERERSGRSSSATSQPGGSAVPTSLMIGAAFEERPPRTGDPWGPDTIADGTPIQPLDERKEPSSAAKPKRSLLVDAGAAKPTDGAAKAPPVTQPGHAADDGAKKKKRAQETTKVAVISDSSEGSGDMTMEDQPLTSSEDDA